MATHAHLRRASDSVTPDDVEDLRLAVRMLHPDSPTRGVLDDLLRALCSSAETGRDVIVDIGGPCRHA